MLKKWLSNSNVLVFLALLGVLLGGLALMVSLVQAAKGAAPDTPQTGAPSMVSYQGQVTVGGSAYDGTGFFKFALVNAAGTATYWSNDGTSSSGEEPTNSTPLPVANGLFNVLLGDTTLTNMTQALGTAAFDGTTRYLRVWFSADNINFEQLDPDQRIASVPYALQAANADTVDGQQASDLELPPGALVLGRTANETTLLAAGYVYTGLTVEPDWSIKAAMPTGRYGLAAVAVDGVVYAIGGTSSATTYETANEAYDPATDAWTAKTAMPTGRNNLIAAAVDGVVYAIGGWSSATSYETANEAYDPATDAWTPKAAMPTGRIYLAAAAVDGVVYAIGGWSSATNSETANEAYDPATDSWAAKAALPTGRSRLAVAAVDGVVYAIGGWSGSIETANEAYTPALYIYEK